MAVKMMRVINGIPTTVSETVGSLTHYDRTTLVTTDIGTAGTGYNAAHIVFTLPNSGTYDGTIDELEVYQNGVSLVEGVHFTYGPTSSETTVTFVEAVPRNARIRFRISKIA